MTTTSDDTPPAPPAVRPPARPVLIRPPIIVSPRHLAAEAVASAALALVQSPALWQTLHAAGAMLATLDEHRPAPGDDSATLGRALLSVLATATTSPDEADIAVGALEDLDRAARAWAVIAHPGARPATAHVPHCGVVS